MVAPLVPCANLDYVCSKACSLGNILFRKVPYLMRGKLLWRIKAVSISLLPPSKLKYKQLGGLASGNKGMLSSPPWTGKMNNGNLTAVPNYSDQGGWLTAQPCDLSIHSLVAAHCGFIFFKSGTIPHIQIQFLLEASRWWCIICIASSMHKMLYRVTLARESDLFTLQQITITIPFSS